MNKERLKEELRRHALEMVERAAVEGTGELGAKLLQSWCDEARDDCSMPLCPQCGGKMRQKEQRDRQVVCHGGDVLVKRKRWWCKECGASFFPSGRGGDGGGSGDKP